MYDRYLKPKITSSSTLKLFIKFERKFGSKSSGTMNSKSIKLTFCFSRTWKKKNSFFWCVTVINCAALNSTQVFFKLSKTFNKSRIQ